jgi:NAD(P)H-dependent flavin oxidoreductase YrpB (nitropropane dioxygenase family)
MIKTRITEMLGIEHPNIQDGMMAVVLAELAAAVSNAEWLGIITALTQPTPEALQIVTTQEAPVHHYVKQMMVESSELDTALVFRTLKNTARIYKNSIAKEVLSIEGRAGDTDFSELQHLVAGARVRDRVLEQGEIDDGVWTDGLVMGLIDDIPSCDELIRLMVRDAESIISTRLQSMLIKTPKFDGVAHVSYTF